MEEAGEIVELIASAFEVVISQQIIKLQKLFDY